MSRLDELIAELCPDGVEYKPLSILADLGTGSSNTQDEIEDGLYPFYVRSPIVRRANTYEYNETAIITPGDGVGVGKVYHLVQGKYALHQRAYRIHVKDEGIILPQFLFRYFESFFGSYIADTMFKGSVASIRRPMLEKFPVPILPVMVQQEIVRILDHFTELTAELQKQLNAELTARKKQYEYYASNLFLSTAADFIPMSNLADFVYGYTDTARNDGDARFIRITDIDDQGYLKETDAKYITLNEVSRKSLLKNGDLLMARTGATYGKTLYFSSCYPAVYASFLIRIIPDESKLLSRYYWHYTKTPLYWRQAKKLVTTGGQPQFNIPAIKQVRIPVPTIEAQKKIVSILDKLDSLCNDLASGLPAEIAARQKQYEYYNDKLLTFKEKRG